MLALTWGRNSVVDKIKVATTESNVERVQRLAEICMTDHPLSTHTVIFNANLDSRAVQFPIEIEANLSLQKLFHLKNVGSRDHCDGHHYFVARYNL